jgi:hypothetical protein
MPRAGLIGICSGIVLLAGFALMLLPKPKARAVLVMLAVSGLAAGALLHPSNLILAAQSSMIGVILTLLGFAIQYLIDSRRPLPMVEREPARLPVPPPSGSTMNRPDESRSQEVGSDESTAIRVRVASTMEYPANDSPTESPERSPGSRIEVTR